MKYRKRGEYPTLRRVRLSKRQQRDEIIRFSTVQYIITFIEMTVLFRIAQTPLEERICKSLRIKQAFAALT